MKNNKLELSNYQVFIVNLKFNKGNVEGKKLPKMESLLIPQKYMATKEKNFEKFVDMVESYCYDTLSRRYNKEVSYCQIFLPNE